MRYDHFPTHRCCSRRHFIVATATAAAGSLLAGCGGGGPGIVPAGTSSVPGSTLNADRFGAASRNVLPVPIPPNPNLGGLHLQIPFESGKGDESATVYDFNGLIGRAHAQNEGSGNGVTVFADADFGFSQGTFRAADGTVATGTFVFL